MDQIQQIQQPQIKQPMLPIQPKTGSKGKIIIAGITLVGLGTAGFFVWRHFQTKPIEQLPDEDFQDNTTPSPAALPASATKNYTKSNPASPGGSDFPIKRGSKGDKVKQIQQVLANKGLLAQSDVIGQYGPKTQAALVKAGYPTTIDETLFTKITAKAPETPAGPPPLSAPQPIDAPRFAQALYACATSKNFDAAMKLLKLMKTTADYSAVSTAFKNYLLDGVRQTLVNGMLSVFTSADQKAQIKQAFLNMGLKYKDGKYSLSGIDGSGVITTQPTTVYDEDLSGIPVAANTVLGQKAGTHGHYTRFKNKGKHFLVPTTSISYL